jgi:hypothetical protein
VGILFGKKPPPPKKKSTLGSLVFFAIFIGILFNIPGHPVENWISQETSSSSCKSLEQLWEDNGGSSSTAYVAAEIAMAESSGNQYATDYDKNRTVDRGYWQINSIWGSMSSFDPDTNAKAAIQISSDGQNWSQWTTYTSGAYIGQC